MGPLLLVVAGEDPAARAITERWWARGGIAVRLPRLEAGLLPDACWVPPHLPRDQRRELERALGPDVPLYTQADHLDRLSFEPARARRGLLVLADRAVDLRQRLVLHPDRVEPLTAREAAVLSWLASRPTEPVSRDDLLVHVFGHGPQMATRTVDNTVGRLRKKIEPDPASPAIIETVRGVGYCFCPPRPAAPTGTPPRPEPPGEPAPLLGRAEDLEALHAALRSHDRITVVGVAGVGKTALLRALCQARPDAVYVDLAGASGLAGIEERLRDAIGSDAGTPVPDLARAGPGLWVLDHAEGAATALTDALEGWLEAGDGLHIVVGSRVRLRHEAEHVRALGPLPPAAAVALLRQTGARKRPTFAQYEGADADLASLADALDRLPLALELAASRARALSVADLRRQVRADLEVVRDDPLEAGPGRSLTGALAGSVRRLAAADRRALAALATCRGGFDLPAALALVGPTAPAHLERLVDHSLVVVAEGRPSRFDLYRTVRRFVEAEADRQGWRDADQRAHAAYFLGEGERWAEVASAPGGEAAFTALATDRENLLAAAARVEAADPEQGLRLRLALLPLWDLDHAPPREVDGLLALVRAQAEERLDPALASEAWFRLADAVVEHDLTEARRRADRHARLAAIARDPDLQARARLFAGHLAALGGDPAAAHAAFADVIDRDTSATTRIAGHLSLAGSLSRLGEHGDAERHAEEALVLARARGPVWQVLDSHGLLGRVYQRAGRLDDALREISAALEGRRRLGGRLRVAWLMATLGALHLARGQPDEALATYRALRDELQGLRNLMGQARVAIHLARVHRARGDLQAALDEALRGARLARQVASAHDEAEARHEAADVLDVLGRPAEAAHQRARAPAP